MWKWVALLLLTLLLAGACARRGRAEDGAEARDGGAGRASSGGEVLPTREITLQRENAPGARAASAGAKEPPPPGGPAARLLPLRGPAVLPEDFRVGPLEDRLSPGGTEQQILKASESFLEALASGRFEQEAVLPESREELGRSLGYYIEEGLVPTGYRLGRIFFEEAPAPPESAWMNLRLYGSAGIAEGEMYLAASGGRWYVADIQAAFTQLREPYAQETERFVPSVYGWRLQ